MAKWADWSISAVRYEDDHSRTAPSSRGMMASERGKYPSLGRLREEIAATKKQAAVYAPPGSNRGYGYGRDAGWPESKRDPGREPGSPIGASADQ